MAVQNLDFVNHVAVPANDKQNVYIELSPRLMPVASFFTVERSAFSVEEVIRRYEAEVVEKLRTFADDAEDMLRSARKQVKNESKRRHYDE